MLEALTVCEASSLHTKSAKTVARFCDIFVLREGNFQVYLLSDHVWIMTCFDLECAIIGPEIHGGCNTGYSTFEYLGKCQHQSAPVRLARLCVLVPSQQLLFQLWRTPSRHISSSNQTTRGTLQESDRKRRGLLQSLVDSSFDCVRERLG